MKSSTLLLVVFAFQTTSLYSQRTIDTSFWNLIIQGKDTLISPKESPGEKALRNGDFDQAKSLFLNAVKTNPTRHKNNYNLSRLYALTSNTDSAFYYLNISLKNDSSVSFLSDPDLYFLVRDNRWGALEKRQIERYELKYGKLKKTELSRELWAMRQKDQAYYKQLKILEQKYGHKSHPTDSLWLLKNNLNAENQKLLKEIVENSGWPKISDVGSAAALAAFLVVQHADYETQKTYKPLIEEAANKQEASWENLALLIDRILIHENKPQLFGSQVNFNEKTGAYEPLPISDEHNLDLRRKKAGLGPAALYYKSWNIQYTVEQNKE